MVQKTTTAEVQVDWLSRNKRMSEGLDHLGTQVVSVNLYGQLLPGITNVTDRARFCAFYPWLIHQYAIAGFEAGDRRRWIEWFRLAEHTYALGCAATRQLDGGDITGVTGSISARRAIKRYGPSAMVDVREAALLDDNGKVPRGSYIGNLQGGFSQYDNALRTLGILFPAPDLRYPDLQITSYAGKPLVEALDDPAAGFLDLLDIARGGTATVAQLADVGRRVQPGAIRPGSSEQRLLRAVLLGHEDGLCKGQDASERQWRRGSLLLALVFVRDCEVLQDDFADKFRWSCANRFLPNGIRWSPPAALESVTRAWATYHRNDLLCVALDALFRACLLDLEEGPLTPRAIARSAAERALGEVAVTDEETVSALHGSVANLAEACRCPEGDADAAAWGARSTYLWETALIERVGATDVQATCALAVRLLGRLATETGTFGEHGFGVFPQGDSLAGKFDVHFGRWLERIRERHDAQLLDFLEDLILEWVLYRHLRVATRKLAVQGLSTFKFRPEEGRLLRVAGDLPTVGFTSPRLRQAYRYLLDLDYLERSDDGVRLSKAGVRALAEAGL